MMRLFDSRGPNPRVVRMFAAEKAIELERVRIDVMAGENRKPPYLALNRAGTTPTLQLPGGQYISEITAICEYLEEWRPAPSLIGIDPEERSETRMWVRRIDLGIVQPMAYGFRANEGRKLFAPRMKLLSSEAGVEMKALAEDRMRWLDAELAGRDFVCGARFSLADIMLFSFLEFGAAVGQPPPAGCAWLGEWRSRITARPSADA